LPKKITRSIAEELSATPQYKKDIWELHKKKHKNLCKKLDLCKKKEMKAIKSLQELAKKEEMEAIKPLKVVPKIKIVIAQPLKKSRKCDQMEDVPIYCIKEDRKLKKNKFINDLAFSFVPCKSK